MVPRREKTAIVLARVYRPSHEHHTKRRELLLHRDYNSAFIIEEPRNTSQLLSSYLVIGKILPKAKL
jgi:hypothetical protein